MKKLLLTATAFCAALAGAQAQGTVLLADTAFTTAIINGNRVSHIAEPAGTTFGSAMNTAGSFRIAEDFTVPAGQTWKVDTMIIYGYQTGSSTTSTFTGATLQIRQNSVTGASVFGDTSTNRMVATSFTGIYRVTGNDSAATNRPIMAIKIGLTPAQTFTAGTYWAIWSASGSGASGPWCPPKVLPGKVNPPGQNAMQYLSGAWTVAKDSSAAGNINLGFNMMLKSATPSSVSNTEKSSLGEVNIQPNPAAGIAHMSFELAAAATVSIKLWNPAGQLVRTVADGQKLSAGAHSFPIDVADLAAGSYFVELSAPGGNRQMKQVLVAH